MVIGTDTRQNDVVFLPSLESVDAGDLDLLVEFDIQGAAVLHVLDDERTLALVGCDDANLVGLDAGTQETCCDLFDIRRLRSEKQFKDFVL